MTKKYIFPFLLLMTLAAFGQKKEELTTWETSVNNETPAVGDEVTAAFHVDVAEDWYIYGSDFSRDCGPTVTTLHIEEIKGAKAKGSLQSPGSVEKYDDIFECNYTKFQPSGSFEQVFEITGKQVSIEGYIEFQVCTEGKCIGFEHPVSIKLKSKKKAGIEPINPRTYEPSTKTDHQSGEDKADAEDQSAQLSSLEEKISRLETLLEKEDDNQVAGAAACDIPRRKGFDDITIDYYEDQEEDTAALNFSALMLFFGISFLSGFVALLTPCVFPMIPMTVTFFTKGSGSKVKGIRDAVIYGLSIVIIYTLIGTIMAKINGPGFANWLATNWIPNGLFFLIFIVFALSFLGLFEITLPSSFVNKMDAKSDQGGLLGIFFMAFTLVLVSFSCTGPIVGTILVESAGGNWIKPIIGMVGFSLAIALPFTLFALFPHALNSLPKSGGWLNSVKVVLGLLELALALKFLSQIDLIQKWGILDREVFLSLWIAIFIMIGIYLLGKIRFPHDSELKHLTIPRALMAIATFSFVVYMVPGLWGAPLKSLSGLLPPMHTQDFDTHRMIREANLGASNICDEPMYAGDLELPHSLEGYFDLRQAICCAKEQNKPIFLDFTGHTCANCRRMEESVWADPKIMKKLREDYIVLAMYGDDKTAIPKAEQYTNDDGKKIKEVGDQSSDFLMEKFNINAQPYYILLGVDELKTSKQKIVLKQLQPEKGYESSIEKFDDFLTDGLARYQMMNK